MANRLTKITTRTGDGGTTGLGDNSRVSKDNARIHALGDVDELNSHIGVLLCESMPAELHGELVSIQHDLFDLGGELCIPGRISMTEHQVAHLDVLLSRYNAELPPLKEFILPGGSRAAALSHVCRTVCRRAERAMVALYGDAPSNAASLQYINRLSDLFFVLSRILNRYAQQKDCYWEKDRRR